MTSTSWGGNRMLEVFGGSTWCVPQEWDSMWEVFGVVPGEYLDSDVLIGGTLVCVLEPPLSAFGGTGVCGLRTPWVTTSMES